MGKSVADEDIDAENLPVRKTSHSEEAMAETEPHNRLRCTPMGKWPDHKYARLRQTNPYVNPKANNYSEEFWTRYQEKTYVEDAYRVDLMRHINFAHMDKHAHYFAEAQEVCE
jgi:hypothetical protein